MRKPRDFTAELRALDDKARTLKDRRVRQLGELVTATGADALDLETLAGALLAITESSDSARKESWRKRGRAFFQRRPRGARESAEADVGGVAADRPGESAA